MEKLIISAAPHIHTKDSGRRIMLDVIIALLPAAVMAVVWFGLKALLIEITCIAACVVSEYLFNLIAKRPQTCGDLTAVVTGLLLALNLSTNVELWQCVVGSVVAIVVAKCLFGGLGHNFANPAITGRVFMILAFSSVAGGAFPKAVELVASATPLEVIAGGDATAIAGLGLGNMLVGLRGGTIGEGCIVALLAGYIYLVCRSVIKWYVPAVFVAAVFVLYLAFTGDVVIALYEILAGGLFLGAIFMATDYVTTPITSKGKVFFALGCGIITFIIRRFCAYPEGVSFSILAMNILTPFIEKWTRNKPLGG